MHGTHFDALVRAAAIGAASRRRVLGRLGGALAAAATAMVAGRAPAVAGGICQGDPENCETGVLNNCDACGFCGCVSNVDGGTACIERFCTQEACATGAECDSGLCVEVPGCCGETERFCGLPCVPASAEFGPEPRWHGKPPEDAG